MNKKLDKLAEIEGLSIEDLATVTGGHAGRGTAHDLKRKHERQDRDDDERRRGGHGHGHGHGRGPDAR